MMNCLIMFHLEFLPSATVLLFVGIWVCVKACLLSCDIRYYYFFDTVYCLQILLTTLL